MPKPYTQQEFDAVYSKLNLDLGRVRATIEQGFAPKVPTDEELDFWASGEVALHSASEKFMPSNELGHALRLARAFHLGLQVIQKSDWKISVIGFTQQDATDRGESFRLYQGASLADAARAISLHLWRMNHEVPVSRGPQ